MKARLRCDRRVIYIALPLALGLGGLSLIQARADRRVTNLGAQVAAGSAPRRHLEEQIARLRQLEQEKAGAESRLRDVSTHLEAAERRLAKLEKQTPDLLAAIETARQSVALIVVSFAFEAFAWESSTFEASAASR